MARAGLTGDTMPTDQKPEEAGGSVREELEKAFAEQSAKQDAEPAASEKPARAEMPEPAPAKADDAKQPAAPAADKQPKPESKGGDEIEPPARWTKEEKEEWAKLTDAVEDPKAREQVSKIQRILLSRNRGMEAVFTKQSQEAAAARQYREKFEQMTAPYREQWKRQGMTDDIALATILQGYEYSNKDPIGFIETVARSRGIDLRQVYGQPARGPAPGGRQVEPDDDGGVQLHPKVQRMLDEANSRSAQLEQYIQTHLAPTVQGVAQQWTAAQQQQLAQMQQGIAAELQQFETAVDDNGAAKYPFFGDVRNDMAQMIQHGLASSLHEAYEKATFANPNIRGQILENARLSEVRRLEKKMADDAKRARQASGALAPMGPSVSTSVQVPSGGEDGIRAQIEAAVSAQMNRARV